MNVVAVRLLDVTLAIGSRDEIVICFKQTIDSIIRPPCWLLVPTLGGVLLFYNQTHVVKWSTSSLRFFMVVIEAEI